MSGLRATGRYGTGGCGAAGARVGTVAVGARVGTVAVRVGPARGRVRTGPAVRTGAVQGADQDISGTEGVR
ncbi:hypothetical protein GCM10022284_05830 [Streptomyces hundungensis]